MRRYDYVYGTFKAGWEEFWSRFCVIVVVGIGFVYIVIFDF